jgi:cytochrome P450
MDAPDHLNFRRVIQGWFTAAKLKALETDIRAIAKASIDHMASLGGTCDFVRDVALTYPLRVLMKLLGIPPEDEALMLRLTQEVFGHKDKDLSRNGGEFNEGAAGVKQLAEVFADIEAYFVRLTDARRRRPSNDLASVIANARIDGAAIPHFEAFCLYLIVNGWTRHHIFFHLGRDLGYRRKSGRAAQAPGEPRTDRRPCRRGDPLD